MMKRTFLVGAGASALGLALVALPSPSVKAQEPAEVNAAQIEQRAAERVAEVQARLAYRLAGEADRIAEQTDDSIARATLAGLFQEAQEMQHQRIKIAPDAPGEESETFVLSDDGASWLGVESSEVSSEKAKELKLPAERGVLLQHIIADSPAAKGGLKDNDVITEINGQRIEGAAQFRRMIHEIPAVRAASFTVWRDGHAQTISVTLGKSEDHNNMWFKTAPRAFSMELPKVEMPELQVIPDGNFSYGVLAGSRPRLGIDAEDLSGQFGAFFGAPEGEGVLVRDVNSGSPAEKAGVKSGDVITSLNGERVRSLGDLREKLAAKREEKTVKLSILRNKNEMSINVEMPAPPSKTPRAISRRTNI